MAVGMGGLAHPWILKIIAKNVVFLVSSGKSQISPFLAPPRKTLDKFPSAPLGKNACSLTSFTAQIVGCETCWRIVLLSVLLRNNSTAINLQTFPSNYGSRRFPACDHGFQTSAGFLHPVLLF